MERLPRGIEVGRAAHVDRGRADLAALDPQPDGPQLQPSAFQPGGHGLLGGDTAVFGFQGQAVDPHLAAAGRRSQRIEGEIGRDAGPNPLGPGGLAERGEKGLGIHGRGLDRDRDFARGRLDRQSRQSVGQLRDPGQGAERGRGPDAREPGLGVDLRSRQLDGPIAERRGHLDLPHRVHGLHELQIQIGLVEKGLDREPSRRRERPAFRERTGEGRDPDLLPLPHHLRTEIREVGDLGRSRREIHPRRVEPGRGRQRRERRGEGAVAVEMEPLRQNHPRRVEAGAVESDHPLIRERLDPKRPVRRQFERVEPGRVRRVRPGEEAGAFDVHRARIGERLEPKRAVRRHPRALQAVEIGRPGGLDDLGVDLGAIGAGGAGEVDDSGEAAGAPGERIEPHRHVLHLHPRRPRPGHRPAFGLQMNPRPRLRQPRGVHLCER